MRLIDKAAMDAIINDVFNNLTDPYTSYSSDELIDKLRKVKTDDLLYLIQNWDTIKKILEKELFERT